MERWKTYSGFIRSFTIGDSPYRVKSTEEEGAHGSALMLLKINPLLQGQPLMPDLRYIRAHGWWLTTGCALPALITLLSTQTERLYLDFTGMFESLRNIPSCIAALTSLAPNLKLLRVNFQIDDTHLEDRQTTLQARVKSMSFILSPLLKRFVQLQTLQLPSMWEPYDALESLQGLPHLRLLDLFDTATPDQLFSTFCQEERTFCSVDNGDVLKFPSLQCLLLKGTNTSLADIFHAYFFPKHSLKALVIRVIKKLDDDYLCFHEVIKAIGNYFPQLQSLHIDTTSTSQASRSGWDQLKSLSPCSDLRRLDVTDCWLTNTDLLAISKAFTKLEELELKDGRALHRLCEDPNDDSIMYDTLEGITIDTLEIVALNLPNLSRLNITVVASDTQSLKFSSHAFQKLSYLQLSWSFINMHLEGFDKKNAAFFLSSLLPTECRFNIDSYLSCKCTLRRFFDSEKFFNTYSTFSNKFSEIVRDFVELRANERERLAHSCSLQEEHVVSPIVAWTSDR